MISFSKNEFIVILLCTVAITLGGCAEINPFEAPGKVIRHPLGTESIKIGMSKEEVISKWRKPDIINELGTTDASGTQREVWVYKARRLTPVPIDAGYLYKNKYLYFDGNNLTRISDELK